MDSHVSSFDKFGTRKTGVRALFDGRPHPEPIDLASPAEAGFAKAGG
jgi:hypothetical protein